MTRFSRRPRAAFFIAALLLAPGGFAHAAQVEVPAYRALGAAEAMASPAQNGSDYSANAPSLSGLSLFRDDPRRERAAPRLSDPGAMRRRPGARPRRSDGRARADFGRARRPVDEWRAGRLLVDGRDAAYRPHPHLFEFCHLPDGREGLVMTHISHRGAQSAQQNHSPRRAQRMRGG